MNISQMRSMPGKIYSTGEAPHQKFRQNGGFTAEMQQTKAYFKKEKI
jgi:hypothetical protein